eukprot:gnl/TRDRNA2_/TRDRNA2_167762_c0_seq2.p1 gnl/TRDRNA2_/TRDRNA2_167762_c0~~gnl/TRDRNA2_/TRDRNA2_167762_c0_seq2.p1  ORF type:complete len:450 (-),score=90.13 gnl/TRDRNA2_/TRDRNA2_167762_c0_seq2:136-1485(-)
MLAMQIFTAWLSLLLAPVGSTRVWKMCQGAKPSDPTPAERALKVASATTMCCTQEFSFPELCKLDFGALEFPDCGAMTLNAFQRRPGAAAGAMESEVPIEAGQQVFLICTGEAVGEVAAEGSAPPAVALFSDTEQIRSTGLQPAQAPVLLPQKCVGKFFTWEEIVLGEVFKVREMVLTNAGATGPFKCPCPYEKGYPTAEDPVQTPPAAAVAGPPAAVAGGDAGPAGGSSSSAGLFAQGVLRGQSKKAVVPSKASSCALTNLASISHLAPREVLSRFKAFGFTNATKPPAHSDATFGCWASAQANRDAERSTYTKIVPRYVSRDGPGRLEIAGHGRRQVLLIDSNVGTATLTNRAGEEVHLNAHNICVEDHSSELVPTKLDADASSMLQDHQPTPPAGAQAPAAAQRVPPVPPQPSEIRLTGGDQSATGRSYQMTEGTFAIMEGALSEE